MVTTPRAGTSNGEQAGAWNGDEGAYWAENADQFDRAVRAYRHALFTAARIAPGQRVLDIGCGTGETTREAAQRAAPGHARGVDLSAAMLRVARQRAAAQGSTNVQFEQADAQTMTLAAESFDVAISRTGTMFFADPVAAFGNIGRALRPGGRLVQLVWQEPRRNEWVVELAGALAAGRDLPTPDPSRPGPFSLSDPDRLRRLLAEAGFGDIALVDHRRPMHFGDTAERAFQFVVGMLGWMLEGTDEATRDRGLHDLRGTIEAHRGPAGVRYHSAMWLVTAERPAAAGQVGRHVARP